MINCIELKSVTAYHKAFYRHSETLHLLCIWSLSTPFFLYVHNNNHRRVYCRRVAAYLVIHWSSNTAILSVIEFLTALLLLRVCCVYCLQPGAYRRVLLRAWCPFFMSFLISPTILHSVQGSLRLSRSGLQKYR